MRKLLQEMISDLKKCPCTFTFMHFMVPKVQNNFQKQLSHKVLHNYYSKFLLGAFRSEMKKVKKMDFPVYFQKWIWPI